MTTAQQPKFTINTPYGITALCDVDYDTLARFIRERHDDASLAKHLAVRDTVEFCRGSYRVIRIK